MRSKAKTISRLTCEGDVKTSISIGVVSQELQPGHVSACCDGRREDVSREGSQNGRFSLITWKQKGLKPSSSFSFHPGTVAAW